MKKIAVMQPYFLPYMGYFQLMASVDEFIFLDDVNYIKKGWINRNRLLENGSDKIFTIPLQDASQNKNINQLLIAPGNWRGKLIKTINQNYNKSPYYYQVIELIEKIINCDILNLADYAIYSVTNIAEYLGMRFSHKKSSEILIPQSVAQDRIINICNAVDANIYINMEGGMHLYEKEKFDKAGIELKFLKPFLKNYKQFDGEFISGLSMLDILMFNHRENIKEFLIKYELIQ
jgi:hypothetical protein